MAPLFYYGYTPHKRQWDQRHARLAMVALEDVGFKVYWHPCREATDYAVGLRKVWDHPGDLFIIEHDVAPTLPDLEAMLSCSQPLCARVYWIALGVAGRYPMLSACVGRLGTVGADGNLNPRVSEDQQPRAGYSAIGCCKLAASVRQAMAKPGLVNWSDVELEVNRATAIVGDWHLHWPVIAHHHGFMEDFPYARENDRDSSRELVDFAREHR